MYRTSKKLFDEMQDEMIFRKHLPRQLEINNFLESLKRKVIHDYDIPISIKELSAEYEKTPFFMDIYKYLTKGHIPSSIKGKALGKLKTEREDYLVIDDVLFRIKIPKDKNLEPLLLVIPESYVPTILYQYHDSLLAGHQGVTTMYVTLKEKFYANNLFIPIRKYVQSCHTCHTRSAKEPGYKAYHTRIAYDFRNMKQETEVPEPLQVSIVTPHETSRISADRKWMPLSNQGFNYILFATCEISNYVIDIPIQKADAVTIEEALLNRVVYQFGPPKTLIVDEDRTLSADVLMHKNNTLNIRSQMISPLNHGSLRTERYIRSISEMLCKHLKTTDEDWHLYVNPCHYA